MQLADAITVGTSLIAMSIVVAAALIASAISRTRLPHLDPKRKQGLGDESLRGSLVIELSDQPQPPSPPRPAARIIPFPKRQQP